MEQPDRYQKRLSYRFIKLWSFILFSKYVSSRKLDTQVTKEIVHDVALKVVLAAREHHLLDSN